jgi:drug/metabolite transporter (DMT)-like permease
MLPDDLSYHCLPQSGPVDHAARRSPQSNPMVLRSPMIVQREGLILCLIAAGGFSTIVILAKLAYAAHIHITSLLVGRFVLSSVILWVIIVGMRETLPPWPSAVAGLLLGAVGYGLQVALLFLSLQRIDAHPE